MWRLKQDDSIGYSSKLFPSNYNDLDHSDHTPLSTLLYPYEK